MSIDTILFDMGGTIEDVRYDRALRIKAFPGILAILERGGVRLPGSKNPALRDGLLDTILSRNAEYKSWSEARQIELPPIDIWTDWNLKDFGASRRDLEPIAEELAYCWETTFFSRIPRPDALTTLEAIKARGYKMGIISNTSSATQVFRTLEAYGMEHYFESVTLSSIEGVRKPAPAIFANALRTINSRADTTAYVGDTLSRDVIGSKKAGYALAIQIESFLTSGSDRAVSADSVRPDYKIGRLFEIVAILDALNPGRTEK
jgi:putative hydrolase of the HAD superfamily